MLYAGAAAADMGGRADPRGETRVCPVSGGRSEARVEADPGATEGGPAKPATKHILHRHLVSMCVKPVSTLVV